ncbi:MAG: DUF4823 domain-containing protein [Verrucomicrobiales bacterium]
MEPAANVLKRGSLIYVAVPEQLGRDGERAYRGSDFQTAAACAEAFNNYSEVVLGRTPENLEAAMQSAQAANCAYLVKPEIRIWEDNPTEWTGERDDLEIDVETFEVSTRKTVARAILKGKSRIMTFGDKPEGMLNGFFEPHAAKLFGEQVAEDVGK